MNQSVTPKKIIGPKKQALVFSEHLCKLVSSLALLWKNGKLCDAGIGNGTSVVVVHKVVLIALSPKLMSTVNVNASHFLLVTVKKSVSYSALVAFAEYMYKGVLDLDPDILSQLRLIALQLEMKELEQLCVDHLDINSLDTNKTFATDSPTHQQDPKSLPIILQLPMKTVSSGSHETAATLTQTLDTNSHDTNKTFATDSPTHQQDPKSLPIIPQIPTKTVSSGSHETAATLTQTLDAKKRHSSHNLTVESPLSPLKKNKEVDSDESSQVSSARFGKHYVITQCTKTNEKSLLDIETEPMLFDMATYSQHPLSPSERCAKSSRDFHQPKDYSNSSRAASLDPDEITAPSISVLLKGTTSNSTSLNDITDCEEYIQRPYPVGLFKSRGLGMPLEVSSKEVEMTPMQICQSFTDITDSEEHIQKPYPMGLFKAKESGMLLEVSSKENEMTFMQITDIHSVPPTRDKFLTKSSDIDLRENINIPHLFSVDGNSMKNWNK